MTNLTKRYDYKLIYIERKNKKLEYIKILLFN